MDKESEYLILADCDAEEITTFKDALEESMHIQFDIKVKISNLLHGSKFKTISRYLSYFTFPLKVLIKNRNAKLIVGWQQFHAINYAFFTRLFRIKSNTSIVAVNFTYKDKKGFAGKIYKRYMRYAVNATQVKCLHVLSMNYAQEVSNSLGIDYSKMAVTGFGTTDNYDSWKQLTCPVQNFALSLGRSNRDFDFLASLWKRPEIKATKLRLLIISDTWQPGEDVLVNNPYVEHYTDIVGEKTFGYISNCSFSIVPIDNPIICSGDTVLLNSMMMGRPVAVTSPSTLSEMYIQDGINGVYLPINEKEAASALLKLITDKEYCNSLGQSARQSYLKSFTRYSMGKALGEQLPAKITLDRKFTGTVNQTNG